MLGIVSDSGYVRTQGEREPHQSGALHARPPRPYRRGAASPSRSPLSSVLRNAPHDGNGEETTGRRAYDSACESPHGQFPRENPHRQSGSGILRVTHSIRIPQRSRCIPHTEPLSTRATSNSTSPMNEPPADFHRLAQLGDAGVLAIIADSTKCSEARELEE